jgi:2-methylcitrate dehydratase PrpD
MGDKKEMDNMTDALVEMLRLFQISDIPDRVTEKAKLCALDFLGCAYAGSSMMSRQTTLLIEGISSFGTCKILGEDHSVDAMTGALINGMNAHKTELDDGHRFAMLHPGAVIFPALLATEPRKFEGGVSFLRGVIAGYEAMILLGQSLQPALKSRGWHATGVCGAIGATAAIAVSQGFNPEQMKNSIAAATTCASGLLAMIDGSSQLKPYNAGQAALNGFVSAFMGRSGFLGPDDPLGGERGFVKTLTHNRISALACNEDDSIYEIERVYTKPYAACRHAHAAIEAALCATSENSIVAENISHIEILTYESAIFGHDETVPNTAESAKMSTPFSVATAIVNRNAGLNAFNEECIRNGRILDLAKKVKLAKSDELTAIAPAVRAADVSVVMSDGRNYSRRIDYPLGEPENPMTPEMITEKFTRLAEYANQDTIKTQRIVSATQTMDRDLSNWLRAI